MQHIGLERHAEQRFASVRMHTVEVSSPLADLSERTYVTFALHIFMTATARSYFVIGHFAFLSRRFESEGFEFVCENG